LQAQESIDLEYRSNSDIEEAENENSGDEMPEVQVTEQKEKITRSPVPVVPLP